MTPYRLALYEPPREVAYCPWCRWSKGPGLLACREPHINPSGKYDRHGTFVACYRQNPTGACERFTPSWLTRVLRRLGRR